MSSVFLRNISVCKQRQYSKAGHWGFKYMGFHSSESPGPLSNRLVCTRTYCTASLTWLSLCPSWHSPWVLAVNQPGSGRYCRAHSSLDITQTAFLHTGWREIPRALPCFGWVATPLIALVGPSTQPVTSWIHLLFLCKEALQDLFHFYILFWNNRCMSTLSPPLLVVLIASCVWVW